MHVFHAVLLYTDESARCVCKELIILLDVWPVWRAGFVGSFEDALRSYALGQRTQSLYVVHQDFLLQIVGTLVAALLVAGRPYPENRIGALLLKVRENGHRLASGRFLDQKNSVRVSCTSNYALRIHTLTPAFEDEPLEMPVEHEIIQKQCRLSASRCTYDLWSERQESVHRYIWPLQLAIWMR